MKQTRWFRTLTLCAALVALALGGSVAAAADDLAALAPPPGPEGILRCLRVVGLSEAQKADIKEIFDAEKDVMKGLLEAVKADGEALKAAIAAAPQDPCKVGTAFLDVRASVQAVHTEIGKIRTNVEAVLTPEQKAKLAGCLAALAGDGPAN